MYKYKQTADVEVGDLVVWTKLPPSVTNRFNNKIYKVIGQSAEHDPLILNEHGVENLYGKAHGFKVLQTKPATEAVVGDYMYRITSGPDIFPQHTIIKITKITPNYLYYKVGQSVLHDEVIVIAQAEQTSNYPVFREDIDLGFIFKYTGPGEGIYLTNKGIPHREPGEYTCNIISEDNAYWKPCDFTVQPDIDDLDWWQQRFEAGLPVYAIYMDTTIIRRCKTVPPKQWGEKYTFSMTNNSQTQKVPMSKEDIELFKQQVPLSILHSGVYQEIPLSAAIECSLQPTTKEQPMNKTTLKLLLELLGASEEVKDATNSKFVGIITNEDEYVGYMYFDSKEDATECMAQPRMESHRLHLFEKSCVLAQKPRKVIEV